MSIIFVLLGSSLFANLPRDEFAIISKSKNKTIQPGIEFSEICQIYQNLLYRGEKKYSNITLKQYQTEGIAFSISAYGDTELDANVLLIEIFSKEYFTKRGITIGSSKKEVISKYGNADHIDNNSYYYFNDELEVLVLLFKFDNDGFVNQIELQTGT